MHSEDGDSLFPPNSINSELFSVCVEGNNVSASWIERGHVIEGEQGCVFNSTFGRMILHITFCRNMISFSVIHYFNSACSPLSDTIGGHFGPLNY